MKHCAYIFLLTVLLQGCGLKEREQNITRKEKEISRREAELLIKEQQLTLKEKALTDKELSLDSTRHQIDSMNIYNPDLIGSWSVKMRCTETSCEGSAIGDTKTEQWEISYDTSNNVTAKAFSGKRLSRIYTGYFKAGMLKLNAEGTIHVTLFFTDVKNKMEGIREITQENCKITYELLADKSQ